MRLDVAAMDRANLDPCPVRLGTDIGTGGRPGTVVLSSDVPVACKQDASSELIGD